MQGGRHVNPARGVSQSITASKSPNGDGAARGAARVGVCMVDFTSTMRGGGICPPPVKRKDRRANPPAFQEGNEFPVKRQPLSRE
jgi:hypothetical protein